MYADHEGTWGLLHRCPPSSTFSWNFTHLEQEAGQERGLRQGVEGGGCGVESGEEAGVEVHEDEVGEEKVGQKVVYEVEVGQDD